MDEQRWLDEIASLKKQIEELPSGYVSKKNINGKIYYYHQWSENGKKKSKYLKGEEVDRMGEQIALRKVLQAKLDELNERKNAETDKKQYVQPQETEVKFETNVQTGNLLLKMASRVGDLEKRDMFSQITRYLYSDDYTRVCAVYGLRRTGKTTMLFQAIADMSEEDFAKAAYVKLRINDTMTNVIHDLEMLAKADFRYVFIDEVTLMEDFIDSAAMFSDVYVPMGLKIVLSGTDSLGFWFAEGNELYDRVRMVHTTFIPFREYSRLLGIDSIDEYIRYGGTLRRGETNFDDEDLMAEDAAFRDDESTRKYIDTAICKNIQHSLACFQYGHYFSHLYSLYDAGELTSAINRIIEDMNHRFVLSVLTKDFKSHDLGSVAQILRSRPDPNERRELYRYIDKEAVTKRLMELLDIRNKEKQTIGITDSQVILIKQYLKALDLIIDCPIEHGEIGVEPEAHVLFTQPGMRYCQAQALVYALMKDEQFQAQSDEEKDYITERVLEDVRGRMLEDIILLETAKALGKQYRVFKYQAKRGEYDMVIRDRRNNTCAVYEIKHSHEYVRGQGRHLMDEEMLKLASPRFGNLVGRYVLYLGEAMDTEDGIAYRNAEEFLKTLPRIKLDSGLV